MEKVSDSKKNVGEGPDTRVLGASEQMQSFRSLACDVKSAIAVTGWDSDICMTADCWEIGGP